MSRSARKSPLIILLLIAHTYFIAAHAQEVADPDEGIPARLEARLEKLEQLLSNQGLLEILRQLETVQMEISRLRGEMEVHGHALEQMKKRQRDLYADIDRRIQRLEGAAPVTGPLAALEPVAEASNPPLETLSPIIEPAETGGQLPSDTPLTLEVVGAAGGAPAPAVIPEADGPAAPATDPARQDESPPPVSAPDNGARAAPEAAGDDGIPPSARTDPGAADAAYRQAFKLLRQSLYEESIQAFREFLARYPDSKSADNAQFWLGEIHYVNRRFEQALAEYESLLRNYPDSGKIAQAQLKMGLCHQELGRPGQAEKQLQELIQQYPGTTAARLAEDRLKALAATPAATDMIPTN